MRLHWTVLVCMVVAQSAVAQPSDRVVDVQVANGVVIHAGGSEYGECGPRGNSSTVYVCRKLRHIDRKDYKYDVNLRGPGSQALKLDPVIRND
jgi:hypothetical protein